MDSGGIHGIRGIRGIRVYLSRQRADMRRSFDGLASMVDQQLDRDPLSGNLFVFRNKRGDRVKILYWNGDGYALWYKRLESGVFVFEVPGDTSESVAVNIRASDLAMLLDGVDLCSVKRAVRYTRPRPRKSPRK